MVISEILSLFISLQYEDDRSILWLNNAENVKFTFPNYLSRSNPFWQSAVYMVSVIHNIQKADIRSATISSNLPI